MKFLMKILMFALKAPLMFMLRADTISDTGLGGDQQQSAEGAEYYQRVLLERLKPELILTKYGQKGAIPKNAGETTSWRRFESLAVDTTALVEGVTPDAIHVDITKISDSVKQYGRYAITTDRLTSHALDPITTEYSTLMGENAGETTETIVRDVLLAGTNVVYPGAHTARVEVTATDKITEALVIKTRRALKNSKVKPIKLPDGSSGYLWVAHPDVIADLMVLAEWKDDHKYVENKQMIQGFVGKWKGFYFVEYDMAEKYAAAGAAGANVYPNIVLGRGAFGITDITGSTAGTRKPKIIIKMAKNSGTEDPLNQRNTIGWKSLFTTKILNQLCIERVECSATV